MDPGQMYLIDGPLTDAGVLMLSEKLNFKLQQAAAQGHPLGRFHSPEGVQKTLWEANKSGMLSVWTTEDGEIGAFLMVAIGTPWWANAPVLVEESMMLFDERFAGFGRVALARMEALAEKYGCAMVHSGNILAPEDRMVENLYTRKGGFQHTYPMFVKVL